MIYYLGRHDLELLRGRATRSPRGRATRPGDRARSPELVGWGGFKGPPRDGVVELGYEIAASRRGRGLATAAVRAMVAEAFADDRVTTVIAHTLPERNASSRVLDKAGFRFDGETRQADTIVWRFSLSIREQRRDAAAQDDPHPATAASAPSLSSASG